MLVKSAVEFSGILSSALLKKNRVHIFTCFAGENPHFISAIKWVTNFSMHLLLVAIGFYLISFKCREAFFQRFCGIAILSDDTGFY